MGKKHAPTGKGIWPVRPSDPQSSPCLVQAPFHAKSLAWSFEITKYVARHRTKNCFAGRWSVGVCHLLYELTSAVNPALSVIALAKWILPKQISCWIPAAVGASHSYNNSHPSGPAGPTPRPCERCVKQRADLAKASETPHSLETVASDCTSKTNQQRILRHVLGLLS